MARKNPKQVLVVDLECTCWENVQPTEEPGRRSEIIEIGIAAIDLATREIVVTESIMVEPPTCELSAFCTQLTTITPAMIDEYGVRFADAADMLVKNFKSRDQLFASWGDFDRRVFEQNCRWNGVKYPFSAQHLNVKALFAATMGYTGGQEACGRALGVEMEGTAHRGGDDAYNIAKILLKLLT